MSEKQAGDSFGPPPPYNTSAPPPQGPPQQQPPVGQFYPQQQVPVYPPNFMPPPQPGNTYVASGGQPGGTTTVIVTSALRLAPNPFQIQCPHCSSQVVTEISYVPGTLAWILCIVFLLFGLWCGCCLIPFCMPECQDVEHRCPNCKQFIGSYRRM